MRPIYVAVVACATIVAQAKEAPVSVLEADTAIKKAYFHLQQTLQLPVSKFTVESSNSPLTRDLLILRLSGMYEYVKPKIQARVKKKAVDLKIIAPGLTKDRQKQLTSLMAFDLVPTDSYLVTGKKIQYLPREFGKILGSFLTQVMDLTHVQDPRFSPELMPDR